MFYKSNGLSVHSHQQNNLKLKHKKNLVYKQTELINRKRKRFICSIHFLNAAEFPQLYSNFTVNSQQENCHKLNFMFSLITLFTAPVIATQSLNPFYPKCISGELSTAENALPVIIVALFS